MPLDLTLSQGKIRMTLGKNLLWYIFYLSIASFIATIRRNKCTGKQENSCTMLLPWPGRLGDNGALEWRPWDQWEISVNLRTMRKKQLVIIRNWLQNAEVQKRFYSDLNRIFKKNLADKLSGRSVNSPFLSSFLPSFLPSRVKILELMTGDTNS